MQDGNANTYGWAMKVIKARVMGFCFGVRRAVQMAEAALQDAPTGAKVYALGQLIHNPTVMESLEAQGMCVISAQQAADVEAGSVVVVCSHGAEQGTLALLKGRGVCVQDATCPKVLSSQRKVREAAAKGQEVVIAGDKNHGEVLSVASCAEGVQVVQSAQEAEAISCSEGALLLAQTTFGQEEFERIAGVLCAKCPRLEVFDSICPATRQRQEALKEISGKADGVLVIGGRGSSNTKRLFEAAEHLFDKAALIESSQQIPEEFFALDTVALTAGASTPDDVINEVELCLLARGGL